MAICFIHKKTRTESHLWLANGREKILANCDQPLFCHLLHDIVYHPIYMKPICQVIKGSVVIFSHRPDSSPSYKMLKLCGTIKMTCFSLLKAFCSCDCIDPSNYKAILKYWTSERLPWKKKNWNKNRGYFLGDKLLHGTGQSNKFQADISYP